MPNDQLLPLPSSVHSPGAQQACLLVADLVDSTGLAQRLPLTSYAALMAELIQLLILHFEAYGGQVLQHQGDAVVCLWPLAQTPQAVQAGLGAHQRAARLQLAEVLGEPLALRVGLAAGEVIRGMVGGIPSAYGLPVNLAARVAAAAQPGQTVVCDTVRALAGDAVLMEREVTGLRGFVAPCGLSQVRANTGGAAFQMKTG
ncbi:adenylate/guanylate cyclase domain-containing protein [Deinococcus sonorensis]|uniref:Adenylate/guanylate cyclase domain-containing protein n=2 Tax=Deinococcus sonorensis TaxID=309891 RepID=A0AAU7UCG9_9DEIO